MNQSSGKLVTLNAEEARSLHAEIHDLLILIATLTAKINAGSAATSVSMDGGGFK